MAGNKEFSLLTKLTLNMAGYDTGIEQAKKKTSDLTKSTETASKSISSSFSPLAGMAGGLTSSLSGIQSAISGGVNAFNAMKPAANGAKAAIVGTGIGALVVALGLAFSALTSYLSGTSAGANKLREVFGYVTGAITAIMGRLKHLGAALVDIFTGQWGKVKEDLAKATASGFFDEIKKSALEGNALAKETNALKKESRAIEFEEAGIKERLAKLNYNARNMDEETRAGASQKIGFVREEIKLTEELYAKKISLAQREYNLAIRQNALKGPDSLSGEDKQKEIDAYKTLKGLEAEQWDLKASHQRLLGKLQKTIAADQVKALKDEETEQGVLQKLKNAGTQLDMTNAEAVARTEKEKNEAEVNAWKEKELEKITAIKATTEEAKKLQADLIAKVNSVAAQKLTQKNDSTDVNERAKQLSEEKNFNSQESALLREKYDGFLISKQEYDAKMKMLDEQAHQNEIAQLKAQYDKGEMSTENYRRALQLINDKYNTQQTIANKTVWRQLQDNITSSQAKMALYGTAINGLSNSLVSFAQTGKTSFKSMISSMLEGLRTIINGLLAQAIAGQAASNSKFGLPGLAMAAIGIAAVQGLFAALPAFETGGIVPGTSYTGDQVFARVNSGEMILNASQQASLFKMMNSGSSSAGTSSDSVKFHIEGSTLVGVLNNYSKRVKNFS